jgi:ubiquinone/menaquinone biosynthesis C-methylase UbiE
MTGWWEGHVVPRIVDVSCGSAELDGHRARVCAGLTGRVLELGFGSGHNVPHYPPAVTEVAAVEPSDVAWRLGEARLAGRRVVRTGLDGQRLEEPDASVDHVLSTFTFCTIPDLDAALAEAARVLRPGGCVHFLEHGRSPEPGVERWQRRLEPVQRRLFGGCHLTRDPAEALRRAGFDVTECDTEYLPGPAVSRPFVFLYRGRARKGGR